MAPQKKSVFTPEPPPPPPKKKSICTHTPNSCYVRPWTYYKWTVYDLSFFDHDDRHRHLAVRILMTTSK